MVDITGVTLKLDNSLFSDLAESNNNIMFIIEQQLLKGEKYMTSESKYADPAIPH